jgi:DNA-binding winged helix-turn-helix (wHTH) protein
MDGPERQVFRFEDVEVDLARGCVTRGGDEVHLRRKSFEVLAYLLAHPGRLITKNELFENVWNNTAVTDDVLVQCIKEVRRSLGDDPHRARFIKTVPKAGTGSLPISMSVRRP